MSINPDAHSTSEIDLTHWGVEMARKGGATKERVLNCLDLAQLSAYLDEGAPAQRECGGGVDAGPGLSSDCSGCCAHRLEDGEKLESRSAEDEGVPNGILKSQTIPQMKYNAH
jgi:hypothetical protein